MHVIALLVAPLLIGHQGKLIKRDIVIGSGPAAKNGDLITVDYKGTLTNGKMFEQSFGKAPYSFFLGNQEVIKGWDIGLLGMKVGGTRRLTVPASLGYGSQGNGDIPANSTLKFEIKLYQIWPRATHKKLIVKVLKPGKGRAVKMGDSVLVHYRGTFPNGFEFDSSYQSGQPLPVRTGSGGAIGGLEQGLIGMKVGEKRKIIIHPDLGYGVQGSGPIPGNATLVFDLVLVKIQ